MKFDYSLDYSHLDLREDPYLYRVGIGEQGVLLVEPYKSEILPHWKFRTPEIAKESSKAIYKLFLKYKKEKDFIGMDMARKFLQMGFTRSRRYANHDSGTKYGENGEILPREENQDKAESAKIFFKVWKKVEKDPLYQKLKSEWKEWYG
jgi:hypothetical protein